MRISTIIAIGSCGIVPLAAFSSPHKVAKSTTCDLSVFTNQSGNLSANSTGAKQWWVHNNGTNDVTITSWGATATNTVTITGVDAIPPITLHNWGESIDPVIYDTTGAAGKSDLTFTVHTSGCGDFVGTQVLHVI